MYKEWVAALPDLPIDMENGIIETQSILENDNMRLGAEGEKKIHNSSIILQKLVKVCTFYIKTYKKIKRLNIILSYRFFFNQKQ